MSLHLVRRLHLPHPRAFSPPLLRRLEVSAATAAVMAVLLCWGSGRFAAGYLTRPTGPLRPGEVRLRLDPTYTKGYLDGVQAGRRAAEMAHSHLTADQIAQVVDGAQTQVASDLKAWGETYRTAFHRGTVAGLRQRLTERFGSLNAPPVQVQRVVVVFPKVTVHGSDRDRVEERTLQPADIVEDKARDGQEDGPPVDVEPAY